MKSARINGTILKKGKKSLKKGRAKGKEARSGAYRLSASGVSFARGGMCLTLTIHDIDRVVGEDFNPFKLKPRSPSALGGLGEAFPGLGLILDALQAFGLTH